MQWLWRLLGTPPWAAEIIENQEDIMATQAELDAKVEELDTTLDVVAAGVSAYAANTAAQDKVIADLKAQIAAGLPVDLTKLEKVNAEAKAIAETFSKVVDPEVPTPAVDDFPVTETPAPAADTAAAESDATS